MQTIPVTVDIADSDVPELRAALLTLPPDSVEARLLWSVLSKIPAEQ